ncbi:MAG: GNAT family N-acetyltransferase [bacterium]
MQKNTEHFTITKSEQPDKKYIDEQIHNFNKAHVPYLNEEIIFLNYVIKEGNTTIAGINSLLYCWKIAYVDILFVEESHRHQGLGKKLLTKVENEAKQQGATLIHLETFDFQAKDFYLTMGFEIFGILDDCPPGHKRYYLKKVI